MAVGRCGSFAGIAVDHLVRVAEGTAPLVKTQNARKFCHILSLTMSGGQVSNNRILQRYCPTSDNIMRGEGAVARLFKLHKGEEPTG